MITKEKLLNGFMFAEVPEGPLRTWLLDQKEKGGLEIKIDHGWYPSSRCASDISSDSAYRVKPGTEFPSDLDSWPPRPEYKPGDLVRALPGCNGPAGAKSDRTPRPGTLYIVLNESPIYKGQWRLRLADGRPLNPNAMSDAILHPDFLEPADDPATPKPAPNPEPETQNTRKDPTMTTSPLKIETRTFVGGTDVASLTNQQIADVIKAQKADIEELKALNAEPIARITQEIEQREAGLKAFIAAVQALPKR